MALFKNIYTVNGSNYDVFVFCEDNTHHVWLREIDIARILSNSTEVIREFVPKCYTLSWSEIVSQNHQEIVRGNQDVEVPLHWKPTLKFIHQNGLFHLFNRIESPEAILLKNYLDQEIVSFDRQTKMACPQLPTSEPNEEGDSHRRFRHEILTGDQLISKISEEMPVSRDLMFQFSEIIQKMIVLYTAIHEHFK